MLPTCLFVILTLLCDHETTAFPAPDPNSVATWINGLNPLTAWSSSRTRGDSEQHLAKRQGQGDGTDFDRNPDGSAFLWVLQDTYEGETFFE